MASSQTTQRKSDEPITQFSIFLENKVGRFIEIIGTLAKHDTHVMAMTVVDTADSAIVRLIFDDPDRARALFQEHMIAHTATGVLVVEMSAVTDLQKILSSLLQAEINILYIYPFLHRPKSKSALVLKVDDDECATHALMQNQFKVLNQRDIAR